MAALLVAVLQVASHAYEGGLDRDESDEPAHYVTSLLGYDYVTEGMPSEPMGYALNYYARYPAVAIGHWPPGYYCATTLLFLVLGPGIGKAILLNGLFTVAACGLFFDFSRRFLGAWVALAATICLISLSEVQFGANHIMAEPLVLLLCIGALSCFVGFLETGRWYALMAYGGLGAMAILTKAVAWSIAPVAVASVIVARRWIVLRDWRFWGVQLAAFLPCAIWEILVSDLVDAGFVKGSGTSGALLRKVGLTLNNVAGQTGLPALILALGAAAFVCLAPRRSASNLWKIPLALFLFGHIALIILAPTPAAPRYALVALPVVLLLAAATVKGIAERGFGSAAGNRSPAGAVAIALLIGSVLWSFRLVPRRPAGFTEAVATILGDAEHDGAVMVSSESGGELIFVGEAAGLNPHPSRFLVRASKVLSRTKWMGGEGYLLKVKDPAEAERVLSRIPVELLILHEDVALVEYPHQQILRDMVKARPEHWRLIRSFLVAGSDPGQAGILKVYELTGAEDLQVGEFELDMTHTLGRSVVVDRKTGTVRD